MNRSKGFMAKAFILLVCSGLILGGCASRVVEVENPQPSVYYWRTTFALSPTEVQFLKQNKVGKLYVRYFDVVSSEGGILPNATIAFNEAPPQGIEIIPTVFIVEQVLHDAPSDLAELLVKRILQMNATHDITGVKEVQLDCDWTERSRQACYKLFAEVRQLLKAEDIKLSVTIRLHQLRMPPPPVDYGVLMLYNTGDARIANGHNPILDHRDVTPYLKDLGNYDLPLCAAYPDYTWCRLFGAKGFKGVLYGNEQNDPLLFRKRSEHCYEAITSRTLYTTIAGGNQGTLFIATGDSLLVSESHIAEIQRVQQAIKALRPEIHKQVIIYPINQESINKRSVADYEKIYNP